MGEPSRIHNLKRPAIERMLRIHTVLKRGDFPNGTTLSKELEVSVKTIGRDIDFMRDRMLLPIDYDAGEHGYYYTREVESLPTIDISEGELLALSIARKSLDHYKGTPFEQPLAKAINKLSASLPDTVTSNLDELSAAISFRQGRLSKLEDGVLDTAIKAALEKRPLAFDYKKPGSKSPERRLVDPYHLTNYLGKWYLIGHDHSRSSIRTFLLSRFGNAAIASGSFSPPASFRAEDYLWNSFGIYAPSGSRKTIVRFDASIADYLSENIWHPTQKSKLLESGDLELSFDLGSLSELASWILSWGSKARAIAPPELRALIKAEADQIAAYY